MAAGMCRGSDPGAELLLKAADVVCSLPPQGLPALLGDQMPAGLQRRVEGLGDPSGALVLYGAVAREALPADCPSHLQLDWQQPGSLFISISQEGDGRAPAGQATVIASVFTGAKRWFELEPAAYTTAKAEAQRGIEAGLEHLLGLEESHWLHRELATPRGFARWTGRPLALLAASDKRRIALAPLAWRAAAPRRALALR